MRFLKNSRWLSAIFITLLLTSRSLADDTPVKTREEAEALLSSLKFQKGEITLRNGLAKINVPDQFRFLDGDDAQTVLVRLWHNPPGPKPLGMLLPVDTSPLSPNCWAVDINYEEEGYVKDSDAEKIDYAALLKQMQSGMHEANQQREKEDYPAIELVGWAAPPRYDKATNKLYWAKEISFAGETEHTLNYNIRVLGRRGVLVLNVISTMAQMPEIEKNTPQILSMVDFNQGHRYADFDSSTDKVATYGIAALVAGGVAAKLGLFKVLWIGLLAAKKFVIIGVVAVVAWLKKLFGKNKPAAS